MEERRFELQSEDRPASQVVTQPPVCTNRPHITSSLSVCPRFPRL